MLCPVRVTRTHTCARHVSLSSRVCKPHSNVAYACASCHVSTQDNEPSTQTRRTVNRIQLYRGEVPGRGTAAERRYSCCSALGCRTHRMGKDSYTAKSYTSVYGVHTVSCGLLADAGVSRDELREPLLHHVLIDASATRNGSGKVISVCCVKSDISLAASRKPWTEQPKR